MRYRLITVMSLVLLLCGLKSAGFTADLFSDLPIQPQPARTERGIPYLSGGVSQEEREALRPMERDYDLKLIFATREGTYLSDVNVTIMDEQGRKVLEAVSDGPWFYTKLPQGRYKVMAQVRGQTHQQIVQVSPQKHTQLQFYWALEGPRTASSAQLGQQR
jgi:hypothetical protein